MRQLAAVFLFVLLAAGPVSAAAKKTSPEPSPEAVATESAGIATQSASLEIEQIAKQDLTERTSAVKDKLSGYLGEKEMGPLNWKNFLQYSIRQAVAKGVSANTIVLVLLFPLVAAMIAVGRHILGLTGFGIFVPALLSVAFVAIGIRTGMAMLIIVFGLATLARKITQKLKLQYLPRMALMMWLVSIGVLGVMLGGVNISLGQLSAVSIFPILILMLLTENFIEVQTGKSRHEAIQVMLQTVMMAIIGTLILRTSWIQKLVLLNPEIYLLIVALLDVYIGKYVGLRIMEIWKFRKLMR